MTRIFALILLTSLTACGGCGKAEKVDNDGDGFGEEEDCNDLDETINPDAVEICDLVDNDCDSEVDEDAEDAISWYADIDEDGYGNDDAVIVSCDQPSGYIEASGDCNDEDDEFFPGALEEDCEDPNDYNCDGSTGYADLDEDGFPACTECDDNNAAINPDADEVCDDADTDEDCDGEVNERTAVDAVTWYIDYDGDGYGSDQFSVIECDQPTGYVDNTDDCDDLHAEANPNGIEICDDLDNNCDGETDDATATDATAWYADVDGDEYGDDSSTLMACDQPESYIDLGGDCDDTQDTVNPDAEELCNDGQDNNCDSQIDTCSMSLSNADTIFLGVASGDNAGGTMANAGDLDGDGYDDLIIGAEKVDIDTSNTDAGAAYVFYGPVSSGNLSLDSADHVILGEAASDKSGIPVRGDLDFNNDGFSDLLISSKRADPGPGTATGSSHIFYGPIDSSVATLADSDVRIDGDSAWDFAGIFLSPAGDINGDGVDDILIAGTTDDPHDPGDNAGSVWLVLGQDASSGELSGVYSVDADSAVKFTGESQDDNAGQVARVGDMDGDGFDDVVIGVQNRDDNGVDSGQIHIFYGAASMATEIDLSEADVTLSGESAGDRLGTPTNRAGDHDGDGYDDVLASSVEDDTDGSECGAVYIIGGDGNRAYSTTDASVAIAKIVGDGSGYRLNQSAGGEDADGDGNLDILVGSTTPESNQGVAHLLYGPLSGTVNVTASDATFWGEAAGDKAGGSVAFTGDLMGTGETGVLIGAHVADNAASDAGAIYLIMSVGE